MPTSTVEDYLKSILLEEQVRGDARVPTGRVATALEVTPGTATTMVKALADGGLLDYEAYGGVRLTAAGRQLALHVLRRHRLIELFLVKVLGFDWTEVHDEAERLEHAVSERLIERIDAMLGFPEADPHGDPIPSAAGEVPVGELAPLAAWPLARRCRVARIADQAPEFLRRIEGLGLAPGARLKPTARDEVADTMEIELGGGTRIALGLRAAEKILVAPVRTGAREPGRPWK